MNNKKELSTREWILIILIISLVQGLIWYASFVNAGNGTALNYVSFAGTLISIILAVLAIGYTYGESVSEKNKSNAISNQIETLNNVLQNLKVQNSNLDKISLINEELLQLSNNFKEGTSHTQKKVEDLKSSLETFLEISTNKTAGQPLNAKETEDLIDIISKSKTYSIQIPLLILYYCHKAKIKNDKKIIKVSEIFDEANAISKKLNINIISDYLYYGGMGTLESLLFQMRLLTIEDNFITLNSDLISKIQHLLDIPSDKDDYGDILYELIVNKINELH